MLFYMKPTLSPSCLCDTLLVKKNWNINVTVRLIDGVTWISFSCGVTVQLALRGKQVLCCITISTSVNLGWGLVNG